MDTKSNIQQCYDNLNFIEDFLEKFDEETGLAFCNINYDEAIWQLRNTLAYIIKITR